MLDRHGGGYMEDASPGMHHHAAAQDFIASLASPSCQRFLGGEFGSSRPTSPNRTPLGGVSNAADARLQQTLNTLLRKDNTLGSMHGAGCGGSIPAYLPPTSAPASRARELVSDMLTTDYRSQLQQNQAALASRDAEVAALRMQAGELKQALAASKYQHATDQLARGAVRQGQLEAQLVSTEKALTQRDGELAEAGKQRRALEQDAATARAQAAAAQKSIKARAEDWDKERRYFKEQLGAREAEVTSLGDALQAALGDSERRTSEWARREADLSAAQLRSANGSAAAQAELKLAEEKLEAASKRLRLLEGANADLRKQKAQMLADMQVLEELLAEADAERKELHDKYCRMGEHMETLVRESSAIRESACQESDAARAAVEQANKGAESAVSERGALVGKAQALAKALEAEQASRAALKDKAARKLAAAEHEVASLRNELEGKVRQLQTLQGDMHALRAEADNKLHLCETQVSGFKERLASLARELESERRKASQAREAAEGVGQERLALELQQQALKYERRVQELEVQLAGGSCGGAGGMAAALRCGLPGDPGRNTVLDYIPRAEHVRLVEARLAAKEADMQLELTTRVHQAEREWQWKLDGKEQEVAGLNNRLRQLEDELHSERQRVSTHTHKVTEEAKRSAAQCGELQRELQAQSAELARHKELLKDARCVNADMDDSALTTNRQVARLRHALEDSQTALRDAKSALTAEQKRAEEQARETQEARADGQDAARRCSRLEAEVAQLSSALEQKQELVTALQAECDGWGAKVMAMREGLVAEVDAVQRQAQEACESRLEPLEHQCMELATELHDARKAHEAALLELERRHAAEVGTFEARLAEAGRREEEARHVAHSIGAGRQQDVGALQASIGELEGKLAEAVQLLTDERRKHHARVAALALQIKLRMGDLRLEQTALKSQVQGDLERACRECLALCESGLFTIGRQHEQKSEQAISARQSIAAQLERTHSSLQQLATMLAAELPKLPCDLLVQLLEAAAAGEDACAAVVADVRHAVQARASEAAVTAVDSALSSLEATMLPATARQDAIDSAAVGRQQSTVTPAVNAARLSTLLGRSQELASQLAASQDKALRTEAQAATCEQELAQAKAEAAAYGQKFAAAKDDAAAAAQVAHAAAVSPLQAEVARLQGQAAALQERYQQEVAALEAAARQHAERDRGELQALQARLQLEGERAQELAARVAHLQEELATHTQRAATKIQQQERELALLKDRVREMEGREVRHLDEIAALKQQQL